MSSIPESGCTGSGSMKTRLVTNSIKKRIKHEDEDISPTRNYENSAFT